MNQTTQLTKDQQELIDKDNAFWREVEEKERVLSEKLSRKVVAIVIQDINEPGAYVVGYMYRPDLVTIFRLIDKGQAYESNFSYEEGHKVLQSLILKGESDPRINFETEDGELYWKGAITSLYQYLQGAKPVLKKK